MAPLISLILLTAITQAQPDPRLTAAHSAANEIAEATKIGDIDTLARLTHPKVAELAGGRDKMIDAMRKGFAQMKQNNVVITSVDVEKPKALAPTEADPNIVYCLLPQTTIIEMPEATVTAHSYLLGESLDNGKTWSFIDGSPGAEQVKKMFPNLPESLKLPAARDPEITPKTLPAAR